MYPFSQSVTPAVRSHMEAQANLINELSKSAFRSFQQICDLNIQLTQTMLEESTVAGHRLLSADRAPDLLAATASRAQPATDKVRAYQQHIARVTADAQVDFARVTETHGKETARTARALADEVARVTSEETERSIHTQQETIRKFSDPFREAASAVASSAEAMMRPPGGNGAAGQARPSSATQPAPASMQSGGSGSMQGGSAGNVQGAQAGSAQGGKQETQAGPGATGGKAGSHGPRSE